ncbi:4996_t:CDS:2 [Ambispora gerdemannii]|uniref:4996_t:CDS:1 n=1 Tax=Ambispora gerdemannii TaxID=144530 RepID=A0A9N9CMN5_9GLOM|nr:4996_t:CDS:2 [Ambispora gerdemannii]
MTTTRYFPFLSRDFARLLETGQKPDISIKVGSGAMTRSFQAHSLILHARSRLFAKLLADKCTYSAGDGADNGLPVLNSQVLDQITPAVFEILLRYIYGGNLPLENRGGRHILELLIGADLLDLTDILHEIQEQLVKNNSDWVVENFGIISRTVLEHPNFKILYDWNQLRTDILSYHLKPGYTPITTVAPPRYGSKSLMIAKMVPHHYLDSTIINKRHAALLSLWIDRRENETPTTFRQPTSAENRYEFKLLCRGTRDGFTAKYFHRFCDSKGPTITILKVKETGELIGGYNPLPWKSSDAGKYQETNESFVFSFGLDFPRSAILSRVCEPSQAVYCHRVWGPSFGVFDLALHGNFAEDGMCRSQRGQYENEIRSSDSEDFSVEEYEVFQVIDHLPQKDIINNRELSSPSSRKYFIYSFVVLGFAGVILALSFWFVLSEYCPCGLLDTIERLKRTIISIT